MPKKKKKASQAKKMRQYLLGYVVGAAYGQDGHEWLFHKQMLCATIGTEKESNPTVYKTEAAAKKIAEKIQLNFRWPIFYRPYVYHTPQPPELVKFPPWNEGTPRTFMNPPPSPPSTF